MKPTRKIDGGFLILLLGVAGYPGMAQPAGTFTPTGSMITPCSGHTATLLFNGKVLIAGGGAATEDLELPLVGGDELYNPSTGTFEPSAASSAAELFDPADATFTAIDRPSPSPSYSAATLLADGTVLISGRVITGSLAAPDPRNLAQFYTPASGTFSPAVDIASEGT